MQKAGVKAWGHCSPWVFFSSSQNTLILEFSSWNLLPPYPKRIVSRGDGRHWGSCQYLSCAVCDSVFQASDSSTFVSWDFTFPFSSSPRAGREGILPVPSPMLFLVKWVIVIASLIKQSYILVFYLTGCCLLQSFHCLSVLLTFFWNHGSDGSFQTLDNVRDCFLPHSLFVSLSLMFLLNCKQLSLQNCSPWRNIKSECWMQCYGRKGRQSSMFLKPNKYCITPWVGQVYNRLSVEM